MEENFFVSKNDESRRLPFFSPKTWSNPGGLKGTYLDRIGAASHVGPGGGPGMGSFLAPEIGRLFGDAVGASLVRRLIANLVAMMCDADVCSWITRDPKVDPLKIESGPFWRARFWSLHFVRCAEILQAAMYAECQV